VAATDDAGKAQAVEDLRQAIQRDAQWREYARTDPDLKPLHDMAYWRSEITAKAVDANP
jgi:hypothetical protein